METTDLKQGSLRNIRFLSHVLLAGILSILLHELGHCIFYWIQGIPAAMSLVKEYPLQDISATQYAIGSTGGPLSNILQIAVAYGLHERYKESWRARRWFSAFILANTFYFILRSLEALLKGKGGELESVASLIGVNYLYVVGLFGLLTITFLSLWISRNRIRISLKNGGFFLGLFFSYVFALSVIHALDRMILWHRFPTIQIDDGREYNSHR